MTAERALKGGTDKKIKELQQVKYQYNVSAAGVLKGGKSCRRFADLGGFNSKDNAKYDTGGDDQTQRQPLFTVLKRTDTTTHYTGRWQSRRTQTKSLKSANGKAT